VNCLHPIIWTMPRKFFTPRIVLLTFAIAALPVVCLAAKDFVMPTPQAAKSYPAHDDHPTEKVSVAVDPYDMADKASIFSVRYEDVGYMPIFVVVTNDGDQPVALSDMKAQLLTVNHSKLFPASVEDLYRRLSRPSTSGKPNPLPWPSKKVKGTVDKKTQDELQNSQFAARAVEPHTSQAGFMFFETGGISDPLAGAHFYLTGVKDSAGNELMYFEIPLEKYLSAPGVK